MVTEHWANRDDLAMARQAGWVPPSPRFLLRAAIARRQAQKRSLGRPGGARQNDPQRP
jgi:hypothetical protein